MRIILLFLCTLFLGTCNPFKSKEIYPKAQKGVLDLREWNFSADFELASNGIIPLDGDWEFYWQELLSPEDFTKQSSSFKVKHVSFPKKWNQYTGQGDGYATYRLKILLPKIWKDQILSIRSEDQRTSYKIYVNEKITQFAGQVGRNKNESIPSQIPTIGSFTANHLEIDVILQVSNFHHRKGGALNRIYLGKNVEVQQFVNNRRGIDIFVAGIVLIIAAYHFIYWMIRKKDLIPLLFTLFCLTVLLRSLFIGEHLLEEIFPKMDYHLIRFIKFNIIYWTAPIGVHFFNLLFPNKLSKITNRINYLIAIVFTIFSFFISVQILTFTGIIYQVYIFFVTVYLLILLTIFVIMKREYAIISFIGYLLFASATINDILNTSEVIDTGYYLTLGMIPMVFSQAIILASKSAKAFSEKEDLSLTLDQKVVIRTSELEIERQKAISRMIELERYNNALANLAKSKAISSGNLKKALTEITEISTEVLEIQRVSIWKYEKGNQILSLIELFDSKEGTHEEGLTFSEKNYPRYLALLQEAQIQEIEDVRNNPNLLELMDNYILPNNIFSLFIVPIWFVGDFFGVIVFEHTASIRKWYLEETNFATSIASLISTALESYERHLAQIKEVWAKAEIEILNDMTVNLVESPTLEDALRFIFDHLMKIYQIELLALYFIDDASNSVFPYKVRGNGVSEEIFSVFNSTKRNFEDENSFLKKIIKRKKVTILSRIRKEKILSQWELSFISTFGIKSIFAMPIFVRNELVGLFIGYNFQERLKLSRNQLESISRFGNQVAGVIHKGKILDETKKQKKEIERLAESRRRLSVIGEMSSGIVHDIKNPMSTIKAFSSIARNPDLSKEERDEYMDLIEREIDRLSDMTFEILDFSKGKIGFNFEAYDSEEFLKEIYNFLKIDFEYAGIRFIIQNDYLGTLTLDKDRIRRVIVNLANNAREAMNEYKKDYEFKIRLYKEGTSFVFCLTDNGPGLPDSIEGKIFEAFATEGKVGGTGLGLFMSKWIVEQHGGNLIFTSEKKKGTSFFISLPDNIERMELS